MKSKPLTKAQQNQILKYKEIWKKSNKKQKIILICKDVITQIKKNNYYPHTGMWAELVDNFIFYGNNEVINLQEHFIKNKNVQCDCCALGGLLLSTVRYSNQCNINNSSLSYVKSDKHNNYLTIRDVSSIDDVNHAKNEIKISKRLQSVFGENHLKLIESYFELNCGAYKSDSYANESVDNTNIWKNKTHENRLLSIMNNIIKNDGKFKPETMVPFNQ